MRESVGIPAGGSSRRGDIDVTKKIREIGRRISFSDLAWMAFPEKPVAALVAATGKHERTVKRWLAGATDRPRSADRVVLTEIWRRLD